MTSSSSAALFRYVMDDIKHSSDGKILEKHGQMLISGLNEKDDIQLLVYASEMVEKKKVKKFISFPSQRSFFRIDSSNPYHHFHSTQHIHPIQEQSIHISEQEHDETRRGYYYTCFEHYCSCEAFLQCAMTSRSTICKHIVAILLADATGQFVPVTIQDKDYAILLCPETSQYHQQQQQQ